MFEEYERASSTIDALSKKVNKRVNAMFEKAEQEYNELKRKKDVVEGDKRRIQEVRVPAPQTARVWLGGRAGWAVARAWGCVRCKAGAHSRGDHSAPALDMTQVMVELDEKKRVALENTWRKVTADFGSIFSTLLPGTTAKLEPQEGRSFLEGEWQAGRPRQQP